MNARQRLFAVLHGEPTDRTPIWLLFPYHRTGYYADVRSEPSYHSVFEASKKYAIMLNRRNPRVRLFAPDVRDWTENTVAGEEQIERRTVEYKGKLLVAETRRGRYGSTVKKLLSSDEDIETYCSLPLNLDPAAIVAEMDSQLPVYLRERAEFPAEYGAMMLDLGEPIGALYGMSQLDEYAVWSLTYTDMVEDFLRRVMQQKAVVYRYCLEHKLAEVYFMVGSELACPPLVSRATFQRWAVPFARELIALIHAHDAKVIQHHHGEIKGILPDFLTMGADALHTIEAPPIGDCTFSQAFAVTGDRMALVGNIQYDQFRELTPARMADAVRAVLDECRGKRHILSPTAGPYEQTITEQMAANYLAFMKTGWENSM